MTGYLLSMRFVYFSNRDIELSFEEYVSNIICETKRTLYNLYDKSSFDGCNIAKIMYLLIYMIIFVV